MTPAHVLITGASSGLGRALATHYAAPGVTLSLSGRDAERLEATAAECRQRGAEAETAILDVLDADAMAAWLIARDDARPVDLVIANAGVGGAQSLVDGGGGGLEATRRVLEINVLGVVNTVASLVPRLVARGQGQVAIMSSTAALVGLPNAPAYSASKAAVSVYGEALAGLLAPSGVHVTVIHPGFVETPMSASLPHKKPMLWTADRAAAHIAAGIARRRRTIYFPRSFRWGLGAARLLPARWRDAVLARLVKPPR